MHNDQKCLRHLEEKQYNAIRIEVALVAWIKHHQTDIHVWFQISGEFGGACPPINGGSHHLLIQCHATQTDSTPSTSQAIGKDYTPANQKKN